MYVKTVKDYLPKLQEMFPKLKLCDIKRMVEYGWRMFYYYNIYGCDVLIQREKDKLWMYCGNLTYDSIKHFHYYRRKLKRKIRAIYKSKKIPWDGYYYVGITEEEGKSLATVHKGRPRKFYTFNRRVAYRIYDEAKLDHFNYKYIIRYKSPVYLGYSYYKEVLKVTDPEIVLTREHPDKFKDIMINDNNYDVL